uniref:Uncharacterized protein n=1 Tax=Tanacetum cinerariifolium TaxID=118510 RepID=A0A6L2MCA1_TANCI|nr:hypothetical protein [Tanacetum cinerariifolium]
MVDFFKASPLRYALTFKPTVYVSHIRQFWSIARIETTEEGTKILTTVDVDEPASLLRNVSQGEACPTNSGFIANQDRENIAKTSTMPHDSAPRVTSSVAAVEGGMQQTIDELTDFCTSLQRQHSELISKFEAQELEINRLKVRVKLLEDREGVAAERSGDDAQIKGRNLDEGEAAAERQVELLRFPLAVDQFPLLVPAAEVPTGSDVVPTANPVFATVIMVTPYRRRKGKEVMIARDAEVARIHVEEKLQSIFNRLDRSNETVAKYLQEYQQFASELPLERRIELISDLVRYQDNYAKLEDFIPMGSKEDAERLKRKCLSLEQKSVKKLKTSKEVTEEAKSPDEVPKEKVKEMMQLVPIEEGRIVGNKMHKAFPLSVIEFPVAEEVPTASEESSHCQKKRDATAKRIALLGKCPMITPRF